MARIRTIKPEFFTSLTIADLTPEQRLTFIGLWTHVDDAGRCVDDPRLIKAAVWPLDDRTAADIEIDLKALTESSLITRYTLNRKRYIAVTSWREHQRINRPTKSKLPAPDQGERPDPEPPTSTDGEPREDSHTPHGALTEDSPQERNREQGTGKGTGSTGSRPPARAREAPETDNRPLPDRMTDAFLDRYKRGNAYVRKHVRRVIADTLANGTDPGELWAALERLGATSRPISDGTLQFAFADIRKQAAPQPSVGNVVAIASGQPLTGTDATVAGWAALATPPRSEDTA